MSAIARVMLEMGYTVTGSDVAAQELTEKLIAKGAKVYIGHTAEQVKGADLVVYSTALSKDNVERVEAERLNIPILHRSQMLARLLNERKGVAVAGAHGKTTTSSMIALVMEECGVDPTYIIGGEIMNVGTNAKAGQGNSLWPKRTRATVLSSSIILGLRLSRILKPIILRITAAISNA